MSSAAAKGRTEGEIVTPRSMLSQSNRRARSA